VYGVVVAETLSACPAVFVATTVNVYGVPSVKPVAVQLLPEIVQEAVGDDVEV
jgi:hypothetical protein